MASVCFLTDLVRTSVSCKPVLISCPISMNVPYQAVQEHWMESEEKLLNDRVFKRRCDTRWPLCVYLD